uniref:Guanine nucleotide binding protein (G protein) alpha v1 n=1 Tax=Xiphophorus couchianus TaxID=32473 RepID=A0A3B5MD38_9TELE
MGLCLGTEDTEDEKRAKINSAKIDRDLYECAKREMNVVKILILGAAESGKSTLVKQMKIIHSNGFTKQELSSFKPAVLDNLLTSIKFVLHGMGVLRINLANGRNKVASFSFPCLAWFSSFVPIMQNALFTSFCTPIGVSAASKKTQLTKTPSFFENMSRLTSADYVPTETDVLRVRLRTTGADCDVDSAARFILATFVSLNNSPKKLIYHHFTTATDTSNIQVVFQVVMETIIKENLEAVSLL